MNLDLLKLLVDPATREPLKLEWLRGPEGFETGLLRAPDGTWYPILDGIPRVVRGELRSSVFDRLGSRLDAVTSQLHVADEDSVLVTRESQIIDRTAASFGFEWTTWGGLLPEYERTAKFYFAPLVPADLAGKLMLDVGCGTGRQAFYAHQWGARVVGLDLSPSIDVAKRNVGDRDTLFVQADLRHPPFMPGTFDLVVSFGVLHHLPDPEGSFKALIGLIRPEGRISVYLYHAFEGQRVRQGGRFVFDVLRRVTTRLPHRSVQALAYFLGFYLTLVFVVPIRVVRRLLPAHERTRALPFATYAEYPFRVIVNDQFDRFATPIENRYRRGDVESWFLRAGLSNVEIFGGAGWRATGVVPRVAGQQEVARQQAAAIKPGEG